MAVKPRRVHLRIDKLVVEGFAEGDKEGLRAAVEAELGRSLAESGIDPASGADAAGGTIARAVSEALDR